MHRISKLKLAEVNLYLVCKLCNGYFIDPCTAQECLHSFCRTCIVRHLYYHCTCPICGVVIHKTRPLEMIRHDQTLQDLVYKLVPGVFKKEMERRREFYSEHSEPDPNWYGNSEEKGEVQDDRKILAEDDSISLALVHSPNGDMRPAVDSEASTSIPVIYLRCPANVTVSSLKKLIRSKYDLSNHFLVDVFHSDESLSDDYTLMDIAYIYTWRRRGPLKLYYTIYKYDPNAADEKELADTDTNETTALCPPVATDSNASTQPESSSIITEDSTATSLSDPAAAPAVLSPTNPPAADTRVAAGSDQNTNPVNSVTKGQPEV